MLDTCNVLGAIVTLGGGGLQPLRLLGGPQGLQRTDDGLHGLVAAAIDDRLVEAAHQRERGCGNKNENHAQVDNLNRCHTWVIRSIDLKCFIPGS